MKKKRDRKHEKRVKKLIIGVFLCGVLLVASTYAWFIGMKTVNVSSFDVKIAGIDGLELSLDGVHWARTVDINKGNYKTVNTSNNTNSWGGEGLIPMSSIGKIDSTVSRLVLYEKGSLTTTPGGYRLMASKVHNETGDEKDGYVVFDLFVKNLSGNEYYDYNQLNEEAIYLTRESEVTVAAAGASGEDGGVAGTGIENSVRVGFAQIGRVKATVTDQATITGITCNKDGSNADVTGICTRDAQIWEPNDTKHEQNAINWYNASCKARNNEELTLDTSYSGACKTLANGTANKTYAVSDVINYTDKVDVYDGEYNGYTGSVVTTATATPGKVYAYPYFTDTDRDKTGVDRPTFMTLAPNSITKVRIYIWIEGQDVDNYDFASLGKKISVQFGFTKERFDGEDVDYDDTNTATLPLDVVRNKPTPTPTP